MDYQDSESAPLAADGKEIITSGNPKNTLLAMDSFFPAFDGVAVCMDNYARYLQKYGEVHFLTSVGKDYDDSVHPYHIVRLPATRLPNSQYKMIWRIFSQNKIRKLARNKFDIVHVHAPFIAGEIARTIARRQQIPLVCTYHASYHIDIKRLAKFDFVTNYFLRRIVRFFSSCDAVWAVNNNSANQLRSYGYKGEILPMYNGTDLSYPIEAEAFKREITSRYHLEKDEFIFCFCGRLMWYKGLKHCFEAMAKLKADGIRFRFFVIGYGEDKEAMEKMTVNLGIADHVVFVGKVSSRVELSKYYVRADLFLLLNTYDTDGLVTKEAAACRTPSLVLRGSNAAERIHDNENGFLTEDVPQAVYERFKTIIAEPDLLNRVGEGAYNSLSTSWEEVVHHVAKVYDEIIAKKKQGQPGSQGRKNRITSYWLKLTQSFG